MDDLVQFLKARYDELEVAAHTAAAGPWHAEGDTVYADHPTDLIVEYAYHDSAKHIAHHDPAHVLAELEGKRQLLTLHRQMEDAQEMLDFCETCDATGRYPEYPCTTLRLLALPYADHPDYRKQWRPEPT